MLEAGAPTRFPLPISTWGQVPEKTLVSSYFTATHLLMLLSNKCLYCLPPRLWHSQWQRSQACGLHCTGTVSTFHYPGLNCFSHPIPATPSSPSPQACPSLQTIFPNPELGLRRYSLELTMSLKLDVEALSITCPLLYGYEYSNFPLKNVSINCAHCLRLQFIIYYNHSVKSV